SMSAFREMYKKGLDRGDQQRQRQKQLLQEQRLRRQHDQDDSRPLPQAPKEQKAKKRASSKRSSFPYTPQVSEWLRHKPEDLGEWVLVPCPVGKRCLVYAHNFKTKAYSKRGNCFREFRSSLPGNSSPKQYTLLDCIYVDSANTFYVLDTISFGPQDLQECEAYFRFYWLRARFQENDYRSVSEFNESSFQLVDHHDFDDPEAIQRALEWYPCWEDNKPPLDGFLFYHKEASYVCGTSPLVCWLFPFMLPDVLDLRVSTQYAAPLDYKHGEPLEYMNQFDRKLEVQRARRKRQHRQRKKNQNPGESGEPGVPGKPEENMEEDSDEFSSLKSVLDHERRLELGELDMDYQEPSSAVSC
ncbi:hypothetical protein KR018_000307, partial [Drosophila ironensis]